MFRCADGITHVMEAIEKGDEVVPSIHGVALRARDFKADLVEKAIAPGNVTRVFDGAAVVIESVKAGLGKGPGHEDSGCAVTAADISDSSAGIQLVDGAIERGEPGTEQVLLVVGTKESLGTEKEVSIVLVPADAFSGAKSLRDFWLVFEAGRDNMKCAGKVDSGQRNRLLGRKLECLRG